MSYVSSLLEVLRATLRRLEGQPEFSAADAHARDLRRYLLIAIADLEERIDDGAPDSVTLPDQEASAALPSGFPPPAQLQTRTIEDAEDEAEPSRINDESVYLVRLSPRP